MRTSVWILAAVAASVFMPGTVWAQDDERELKRWFEKERAELEKRHKQQMMELERRFKEKFSGRKKQGPKQPKVQKFRVEKKIKPVEPLHGKNQDWKFCPWCGHSLKGKADKSGWKYAPKKAPGKNFEFKYLPDKTKEFYKKFQDVPDKAKKFYREFKEVPDKAKKFYKEYENKKKDDDFDFDFELEGMELEKLKDMLKKLEEKLPRRDDDREF